MLRHTFAAMGSTMTAVLDTTEASNLPLLAAIPDWFASWERQLSRFDPASELSRLNARPDEWVSVSPILWDVLQAALDAARVSEGLVTPAVLDALLAAGYDRSFPDVTRGPGSRPYCAGPVPDWRGIQLDDIRRRVQLPTGLRLDLGGVAKGWAATQALSQLSAQAPALLDAGGDIVVSGPMQDISPWPIAIASPCDPEQNIVMLALRRGAVATSGRDYRRWRSSDGRWRHHLIDPRTGQPANTDVLSATVVAPNAASAELAAKVALLLGTSAGCAWLDAHPELAGLLVREDGALCVSTRMECYFWKEHLA
jgi:FAD:protein FMN transferase